MDIHQVVVADRSFLSPMQFLSLAFLLYDGHTSLVSRRHPTSTLHSKRPHLHTLSSQHLAYVGPAPQQHRVRHQTTWCIRPRPSPHHHPRDARTASHDAIRQVLEAVVQLAPRVAGALRNQPQHVGDALGLWDAEKEAAAEALNHRQPAGHARHGGTLEHDLHQRRQAGLISEEDFEEAKVELFARLQT